MANELRVKCNWIYGLWAEIELVLIVECQGLPRYLAKKIFASVDQVFVYRSASSTVVLSLGLELLYSTGGSHLQTSALDFRARLHRP